MRIVPRILLVFVDGLGLGSDDPAVNLIHSGACPHLEEFLLRHCVAADAQLGVAGVPQSATGQTTLLTGVNAARVVGRHVEGFPGRVLKGLVESHNVLRRVVAGGRTAAFANGYFVGSVQEVQARRMQSVTTVATLSALGAVRCRDALERNEAVCHDLTRETLVARGYAGPLIAPETAADHLAAIARSNDLTLFEYFLTDRAGHSGHREQALAVLHSLDRFLAALAVRSAQDGLTLLLTSDHGNIEDTTTRTHTANPVPFGADGPGSAALRDGVASLIDVTPAILRALGVDR